MFYVPAFLALFALFLQAETVAPDSRSVGLPTTQLYSEFIGSTVADPYEWCLRHACGPSAAGPADGQSPLDYAKRVGWHHLLEAAADLDGDGVRELLVRPEMAARVYPVFVFARKDKNFVFAGNLVASHLLRPDAPGAPLKPRILVYEACGGKCGYIKTYELGAAGFRRIGGAREVWSGDGYERGTTLLERTFPSESVLKWEKVVDSEVAD
jgi:hypothetical protein